MKNTHIKFFWGRMSKKSIDIARYYNAHKDYKKAIIFYNKFLDLNNKPGRISLSQKISVENELGDCYFHTKSYKDAIRCFQEGLSTINNYETKTKNTIKWQAHFFDRIGYCFFYINDYKNAILNTRFSLDINKTIENNSQKIADNLYNLGSIHCWKNNFLEAKLFLQKGLQEQNKVLSKGCCDSSLLQKFTKALIKVETKITEHSDPLLTFQNNLSDSDEILITGDHEHSETEALLG